MKYYLITLKDNQQVIASDDDVCAEDYFFTGTEIEQCLTSSEADDLSIGKPFKKVIAGLEGLPEIDFSKLNQIPEVDFNAIRVVVDVDKLANDVYPADAKYKKRYNWIWKEGFYASQELKDELTEKTIQQTAIDFAMYLVNYPMTVARSTTNTAPYMFEGQKFLQGLLLAQGAKIFKEFQDRPKIFEIEVEMECVGFETSTDAVPEIKNNQIKITKILKKL